MVRAVIDRRKLDIIYRKSSKEITELRNMTEKIREESS